MGASDPPPEHHSGVLEFCGGMMLNKLQNGNEGTTLIKEDRISHLPDHILGEILAFIPLKDAVATSVLSRRWRRVFTWVTYLNLDDTPNCHDYCLMRTPHTIDSFPNFKMYVDKVLQLCHSNNMDISTYILHFGKRKGCFHNLCFEGCLPVLDPMHLDAWISFPLACGVKVLDIIARVRKPSKIPSALYRCPTLEVLKLDVNVNNLDLNISFRIHLPNLKVIHLTFLKHTPNDDSVAMLVASCPSLQDLVLNAECFININLITSQSLRRLVINFSGNTWIDITSFTTKRLPRREFELDVPNLEHLTYVDSAVVIYSITKMNNLVNAQVDVTDLYFDGSIFGIFSGLSNVQSLYLMSRTTNTMALMACGTIINLKLPLFGNLKHLQLGCEGYYNWNNVLIELLHRAPFLETLTFMEFFTFFPFLDFQEMIVQEKTQASSSVNDDIDLDELMDDPELEKLHSERIAALQNQGHGEYRDITEGDFLGEVTGSELVICHFYHQEFYLCKVSG
ncbi:F-box/LRR-repeat protein At4g14103-like isoform X3 [Chenopodium quinoa]|uniref:F-box/LRR-repeat protein At4g14103-like isoform X3 n=1 Tax=Chenopodium quinoa TaxID=63459 RepID=UPI000B76BF8D|nr:F-box/LRR-repeat protein At4g14103-like isoform X3 [Chenopodium quinoa]